jgi:hypothetical protein
MKALQAACIVGAITFTGMIHKVGGNTPGATMPEAAVSAETLGAPAQMSGFGVDQGAMATSVALLRWTGEPGKASPIRGGGRTEKRTLRREPGKSVAVWSSV